MTPTALTIRTAREGDAHRLVEILSAGALGSPEDSRQIDDYVSAIREIEAAPGSELLVAEFDGLVVGTCQLIMFRHLQHRGGRCAEIESMHVVESHRSRGVGSALLDAAISRARQAGCYRVQLTSNKVRGDAHRFYRRHGFVASHEGFKLLLGDQPAS